MVNEAGSSLHNSNPAIPKATHPEESHPHLHKRLLPLLRTV